MTETNPKKTPLRGVLHLWSETGTEGGYWAFQDERFIKPNTTCFHCAKCFKYWDKKQYPDGPPTVKSTKGPLVVTKSVPLEKTLSGKQPPECAPDEHVFEPTSESNWSYDGLHVLEDGDELTIFSKDNPSKVVWSGKISLRQFPAFSEDANGLWIHADQAGLDRKVWAHWFLEEYPAELISAK